MSEPTESEWNAVRSSLEKLDGVQAVGESVVDGLRCLKVYFSDEQALQNAVFPKDHGVKIVTVVSGEIRAQDYGEN